MLKRIKKSLKSIASTVVSVVETVVDASVKLFEVVVLGLAEIVDLGVQFLGTLSAATQRLVSKYAPKPLRRVLSRFFAVGFGAMISSLTFVAGLTTWLAGVVINSPALKERGAKLLLTSFLALGRTLDALGKTGQFILALVLVVLSVLFPVLMLVVSLIALLAVRLAERAVATSGVRYLQSLDGHELLELLDYWAKLGVLSSELEQQRSDLRSHLGNPPQIEDQEPEREFSWSWISPYSHPQVIIDAVERVIGSKLPSGSSGHDSSSSKGISGFGVFVLTVIGGLILWG